MQETGVHLPELLEVHFHQDGHVVPGTLRAPPWNRRGHGLKRYSPGQGRPGPVGPQAGRVTGGLDGWVGAVPWEVRALPHLPPSPLVHYNIYNPRYTT